MRGVHLALLALPIGGALQAQAIKNEPPMRHFSDQEVAAIAMPALAFEETAEDVASYDKYFYFHRPDTGFDEAYADILECDSLGSGINIYVGASDAAIASAASTYGYGAGAIGGVLASAMIDAIVGSAERRKARRFNMRTCMHFKGYDRYGLSKGLWQTFNFEEGNDRAEPEVRTRDLMMQARVASSPRPQQEVLAP